MKLQEAINILGRAGRGPEARKLIEAAGRRAKTHYDAIRADASLSEQGQAAQLTEAHAGYLANLADELTQRAEQAARDDRLDCAMVFGTWGIAGDATSLTISRRDAADRVSSIDNPDDLLDLLRRATRSSDEVLARAIAQHATENGYARVMHAFVADRPELDAAAERLWNAAHNSGESMAGGIALMAIAP